MTGGSSSSIGRSDDGDVEYSVDYDVDDEIDGGGRSWEGGVAQAEMTGGSFSSVGSSATSTQAEVSTLGWGRGRGRPSRGRRGRTCASQLDSVDQGIGFTRKSHNMREALCRDSFCEEEVDNSS